MDVNTFSMPGNEVFYSNILEVSHLHSQPYCRWFLNLVILHKSLSIMVFLELQEVFIQLIQMLVGIWHEVTDVFVTEVFQVFVVYWKTLWDLITIQISLILLLSRLLMLKIQLWIGNKSGNNWCPIWQWQQLWYIDTTIYKYK